MAKLPNADLAIIEEQKITGYLLSRVHPVGKAKADFFARFGWNAAEPHIFAAALRDHAKTHEVAETETTPFGVIYAIVGPLTAPDGRAPIIRAVWMIDAGSSAPRLVTVFPA